MLHNERWEKPEVKTQEEWRKALLDAADLIEHCGWVQGELGDKNIGFCVLGAIEEVVYFDTKIENNSRYFYYSEAANHFINHIRDSNIPEWNDYKQRTKQEVIEAMRAAAAQE